MYTGLEVLYELLLDLGLATDPLQNKPWPAFIGTMPDIKPEGIALTDIGLPTEGRLQKTGETIGHDGIQVRVSAKTYRAGRQKLFEITEAFDNVLRHEVPVENVRYLVHAVHRDRQPVYIGQDENDRDSFTLDFKFSARKV